MRALLLLLVPAIADAAPLEMRYLRSENLHIANQGGAINWFDEVTITLDLQAGGKLVGKETGKMREHNLYDNYTTEELQTWTHAWRGTWKQTGAALALDVVLDNRKCTHTKQPSDGAVAQLTCGKVSTKIHFDCTTTQVVLRTTMAAKHEVWQCVPTGTVDLDRTPTPWVFRKTGCVKMLGGRDLAYDRC